MKALLIVVALGLAVAGVVVWHKPPAPQQQPDPMQLERIAEH